jgi:prevent-host-death family protein
MLGMGEEVGLREVRQHASELVRRAQAGERLTITVSGRPAASLGPVEVASWVAWEAVADLFSGPGDPDWQVDQDQVDGSLRDPWAR